MRRQPLSRLIPRSRSKPRAFPHHWPHRKKLMPARIAAHCRQCQHTRQNGQAPRHIVRRNLLQFQVSAYSAPRKTHIPQRHGARVKSFLALNATPRNHSHHRQNKIDRRAPPRASGSARMANRTNHRGPSIPCFGVLYFIID